jgi:putative DNA primase/helicase
MEGVLCLYGRQGIGKTSWAYGLIPKEYGNKWIKDAVALDVHNKDSVMKAVGTWITELGELDSTFKKSDLEALKAWITEKQDVIRPPYERSANKYTRRTGFYATLNTLEFLNDDENRRFWVLDVDQFRYPEYDLGQFWAQIKVLYKTVSPLCCDAKSRSANNEWGWFLTPAERAQLQQSQNPFKTVDPVIEKLSTHIVAQQHMKTVRGENLNITEILERCGLDRVTKKETTSGGKWLREQGFKPDRQKKYTVEIVDRVKTLPHLKVVDTF